MRARSRSYSHASDRDRDRGLELERGTEIEQTDAENRTRNEMIPTA